MEIMSSEHSLMETLVLPIRSGDLQLQADFEQALLWLSADPTEETDPDEKQVPVRVAGQKPKTDAASPVTIRSRTRTHLRS